MSSEEFRTLTAVEMGSKNHEVVPTQMIANIANLKSGGSHKHIAELARNNLIARVQNTKYDGYRLTYGGYDFLALKAFANRDTVTSVGYQIGVGKESDVYIVSNAAGEQCILKIQRLGRISFRQIKNKRDYLQKRKSASWMYMSRLASMKEYAFMKVLHEHGFPVPRPLDQNRHCVVMELIEGFPLYQIREVEEPGRLYSKLMDLIVRIARSGLIHGDFNEFNILIRSKDEEPILIDFPQMVSTSHRNAEYYFDRDVVCIRTFFRKRFGYESRFFPKFNEVVNDREADLDIAVSASGFTKKQQQELEELAAEQGGDNVQSECSDTDEEVYEEDEEEELVYEESEGDQSSHGSEVEEEKLAEQFESTQINQDQDRPNNHQFAPFRDYAARTNEISRSTNNDKEQTVEPQKDAQVDVEDNSEVIDDVSSTTTVIELSMSRDEIKQRIKQSAPLSSSTRKASARNMTKNHGKHRGNKVAQKQFKDSAW